MAVMTCRTTFSFDQNMIHRLKNLSSRWRVAQTEEHESKIQADPIKMLALLRAAGEGLSKDIGNAYLKKVYEERKHWRERYTLRIY